MPVVFAEVEQQADTREKSTEGLTLEQAPSEPGTHAQVLGLGLQQRFAAGQNLVPVDFTCLVGGLCLVQLVFQVLERWGVSRVVTCELAVTDR
ncbi:hypothetical protein D3C81_2121620 [compost metagenome]